ncbi:TPA: hypothetical protein ACGVV9_001691 [Enterococcus faecium]
MTIAKDKQRKFVTLRNTTIEYLENRAKEETKRRKRNVTVSELLDELAENDKTIRTTFIFLFVFKSVLCIIEIFLLLH